MDILCFVIKSIFVCIKEHAFFSKMSEWIKGKPHRNGDCERGLSQTFQVFNLLFLEPMSHIAQN